jgi:tetratricopeptide (TPR) repeat protein
MKLIAGQTLADELLAADRPRLVQAFAQVCQAVGFAHSRGVIHRDLKPANVMVGAFGEVQVMDWGLAKDLTGPQVADDPGSLEPSPRGSTDAIQTVHLGRPGESTDDRTRAGTVLGTPAYMAPEQARGEPTDARSDVFALGGILCAILTGQPTFRGESAADVIDRAAAADLADANARLDGCGADAELVALCRRCLSADPADRPADGRAVADGVTAYRNGVQERLRAAEVARAEATERARAERRTRRIQLWWAGVALVVFAAGIVGTTINQLRAERAKEKAEIAEGEAKKRADELQAVSGYQSRMLRQVNPMEAGARLATDLRDRHRAALEKSDLPEAEKAARVAAFDREMNAVNPTDAAVAMLDRTVLTPAVQAIETQFADQPVVDASLRATLGDVYHSLGRYQKALALYRRAYDERVAALGEDHRDSLAARVGVGTAEGELQDLAPAETTLRAAVRDYERLLGADHKETLDAKCHLATVVYKNGRYDECVALAREVLDVRRRAGSPGDADALRAMNDLGKALTAAGRYDEGEAVLREVVEARRRVPGKADGDDALAAALSDVGGILLRQKRYKDAEPYVREALERRRRELGDDHPLTVINVTDLAWVLMDLRQLRDAEALAREGLARSRRLFGNDHAMTLKAVNHMGQLLFRQDKFSETEQLYREALTTGRRVLGEDHPEVLVFASNLGSVLQRQGRLAEAEPYFREAAGKSRRLSGAAHPYTILMTENLVELLLRRNKLSEAEKYVRGVADDVRRLNGDHTEALLYLSKPLTESLRRQGKLAEAEACSREALKMVERVPKRDGGERLEWVGRLGGVLRDQGKLAEAEPFFREGVETSRRLHGEGHRDTVTAVLRMGSLLVAQGKHTEAIELLAPLQGKVTAAIPGQLGLLRSAYLVGMLGKSRAALAKQPAEFAAAEANLLEARGVFASNQGEKDKETRDWTKALVDFYAARDKAEPGKGYDAKAAEWKAKVQAP